MYGYIFHDPYQLKSIAPWSVVINWKHSLTSTSTLVCRNHNWSYFILQTFSEGYISMDEQPEREIRNNHNEWSVTTWPSQEGCAPCIGWRRPIAPGHKLLSTCHWRQGCHVPPPRCDRVFGRFLTQRCHWWCSEAGWAWSPGFEEGWPESRKIWEMEKQFDKSLPNYKK